MDYERDHSDDDREVKMTAAGSDSDADEGRERSALDQKNKRGPVYKGKKERRESDSGSSDDEDGLTRAIGTRSDRIECMFCLVLANVEWLLLASSNLRIRRKNPGSTSQGLKKDKFSGTRDNDEDFSDDDDDDEDEDDDDEDVSAFISKQRAQPVADPASAPQSSAPSTATTSAVAKQEAAKPVKEATASNKRSETATCTALSHGHHVCRRNLLLWCREF
eukprot:SAG31_NODE_2101_length_6445_cov_16.552159_4_plen_220_part_00